MYTDFIKWASKCNYIFNSLNVKLIIKSIEEAGQKNNRYPL